MNLSRRRLATIATVTFLCGASSGALAATLTEDDAVACVEPEQDARVIDVDRVEIPVEFRVPVGDGQAPDPDAEPVGWTDQRLISGDHPTISARESAYKPFPVIDDAGTVVGYLFESLGYVERDRAWERGFSIREEYRRVFDAELPDGCDAG